MKKAKKGITTIAQTNAVIIFAGLAVMLRIVAAFIEDDSVNFQLSDGIGSPVTYIGTIITALNKLMQRRSDAVIRRKIR